MSQALWFERPKEISEAEHPEPCEAVFGIFAGKGHCAGPSPVIGRHSSDASCSGSRERSLPAPSYFREIRYRKPNLVNQMVSAENCEFAENHKPHNSFNGKRLFF